MLRVQTVPLNEGDSHCATERRLGARHTAPRASGAMGAEAGGGCQPAQIMSGGGAAGRPETTAFVGLGSNVGDRLAALRAAIRDLDGPGVRVVAASPVYATEAHVLPGAAPQPDHLNAVLRLETALGAHALLARLHAAERAAGRDPSAPRWSPRPLDADLLLFGTETLDRPGLVVPHPRLAARRFVLAPLADLAPDLVVPGTGRRVADLLAACPDAARIARTDLRVGMGDGA